jgi:ubiquinone/menaquinone biosynthesis C-methylase UbiE
MYTSPKTGAVADKFLAAKAWDLEIERIRSVYARRRKEISRDRYALISPFNLLTMQERECAIASFLRLSSIRSLAGRRILDIGCGRGLLLRRLLEFDAEPNLLYGVDLIEEYVAEARRLSPHFKIMQSNAAALPFADASFDLVNQATVFSSILDPQMKHVIASEMLRVLKSGGLMLWYDFFLNNPRNPDVRGVRKKEIRQLFPGCDIRLRRITLAPPIGRLVAPHSPLLYMLLSSTRILCTHYLGLIKKK